MIPALIGQAGKQAGELCTSLAWERGREMADHPRLAMAADIGGFFCGLRAPWRRVSNEDTNRLLRKYLQRATDLSVHSQARLSAIARQRNARPRETLQYRTPAEKLSEGVAATS